MVPASSHPKGSFLPTRPWISESHIAMIVADYTEWDPGGNPFELPVLFVPVLIRVEPGLDNHHSDLGRNQQG